MFWQHSDLKWSCWDLTITAREQMFFIQSVIALRQICALRSSLKINAFVSTHLVPPNSDRCYINTVLMLCQKVSLNFINLTTCNMSWAQFWPRRDLIHRDMKCPPPAPWTGGWVWRWSKFLSAFLDYPPRLTHIHIYIEFWAWEVFYLYKGRMPLIHALF